MDRGRVGDLGLTVDERDAEVVNYELLVDRADELRAPLLAGGVVARPVILPRGDPRPVLQADLAVDLCLVVVSWCWCWSARHPI